jgi:MoxR-like ATPase
MMELRVRYPSREEEERIVVETTGDEPHAVQAVLQADDLLEMQHLVRRIPVSHQVVQAAVHLARMTRPGEPDAVPAVNEYVAWGAGPRASQFLVLGAKAQAAMDGRPMADLDDVKKVALAVLRHRLVINFAAEASGRTAESICRELIDGTSWMR